MATHARAWAGIDILVIGSTPNVPMQLEQALAGADPSNETVFESFEKFEDAYDFCKSRGTVGLLLVLENCGNHPPLGVFQQLAAPFETKQGPCFGVLLHDNEETIAGHSTVRFSKGRILSYVSIQEILSISGSRRFLNTTWDLYAHAVEDTIAPEALRTAIYSIVEKSLSEEKRILLTRICNSLVPRLTLSYWEMLGIQWWPIMNALKQEDYKLWETQETLRKLCKSVEPSPSIGDVDAIVTSKASLAVRVSAFIRLIATSKSIEDLENILANLASKAVPGSPGLIRQIAKARESILVFAREWDTQKSRKIA